ncbi:MAG: peptide deformylase [bacterium]|nr:peptide deformylase [bacterium]
MRILTIHKKPDEKILRTKAAPFQFGQMTRSEMRAFLKEMRQTMGDALGVGLAANQVGLTDQLFVAECDGKFYAVFNPKIEKTFGELIEMEEGCLSVPGLRGTVKRYEKILLTGFDQNGKKLKIKAWGLLAHIFQHETDHLLGKLYIDKATRVEKIDAP